MDEDSDQDRYVAQLQEVFNSCDSDGDGHLNHVGLTQLCQRLQLEEQAPFFIDQLLHNNPAAKVNFTNFKDGFIKLLAQTVDDSDSLENYSRVKSPEREISPKYTWGSKKYGRRSRPESCDLTDCDNDLSDVSDVEVFNNDDASRTPTKSRSLDATNMELESDMSGQTPLMCGGDGKRQWSKKKRRRSIQDERQPLSVTAKLRTLHCEGQGSEGELSNFPGVENDGEYLRTIWRELAVGVDGFLDLSELEKVCEHIGMEKMSQEVVGHLFAKLDTDQDGRISFEEFLHLFQHGEPGWQLASGDYSPKRNISAWNEHSSNLKLSAEKTKDHRETSIGTTSESGMFSAIDPRGTGYADPDALMELWDNLGINNGAHILKELGLTISSKVRLQDLSCILEECLVSTEDTLLHQVAVLSLQNELKHVRNSLDQVLGERNKLKTDVSDANVRASLLAQEVDDQNAKLEKASQNRILRLEKKYHDQIQGLQDELFREREQLATQVARARQSMEMEVQCLREEEVRLREKITFLQKENDRLENESREFMEKLEETNKILQSHQRDSDCITQLRQRVEELETGQELYREHEQQQLIHDLQAIKLENQTLRDRNDELLLEVESLRQQLEARPVPRSVTHKRNGSWLDDYVRNPSSKRRGFSASTAEELHLSDAHGMDISPKSFEPINCNAEGQIQGKLNGEVELETLELSVVNSDENPEFECGLFDDIFCQDPKLVTSDIKCELDRAAAPAWEMKQVFQYLQKQMKEEVISQSSVDEELVNTLEKEKKHLLKEIECLRVQHEDELNMCNATVSQKYQADIDELLDKCAYLQQCMESFKVPKSNTSCENVTTQTENDAVCLPSLVPSARDIHKDVETQCVESNFHTIDELNQSCLDLGIRCDKLKGRLDLAMDELEMALDREGEAQEHLVALEGKYNSLKRRISPKILMDGNRFVDGIDVIGDFDTKLYFDEREKHRANGIDSAKFHHQSAQVDLTMDEFCRSEDPSMSSEAMNLIESKLSELKEKLKVVQLTNHELATALEKSEDEQKFYKQQSENIAQIRQELEERMAAEKEMHQQQMEALELYWKNQMKHVKHQHEIELNECTNKISHLEETLNDVLESSDGAKSPTLPSRSRVHEIPTRDEEVTTDSRSTRFVEVSNQTESQKLVNETNFIRLDLDVKDSASLRADCQVLHEECTHLSEKKQHLEEEVAVLELEWASLEGYLSSQRSQVVTTEAEIHHGPDSYPSTSSTTDDDLQSTNTSTIAKEEPKNSPDNKLKEAADIPHSLDETPTVKTESDCAIDVETMHTLNLKLRHLERRCRYLEETSRHQTAKADQMYKKMKSQHKRELDQMKDMLLHTQKMLQRQAADYESQLQKADSLVKTLYVENAQVVKALQVTEERQKKFEHLNGRLQDKCQALTQLVSEIYKTAIS